MNQPPVNRRIPALDGLRGIAIVLVLIWHYLCCQIHPGNAFLLGTYKIFEWTWSGVDLFFVLSGFLIGGVLLDHRNSVNLLPVFYCRRALRILPPYAVVLVLFFAIQAAGPYPSNQLRLPWLFDGSIGDWSYLVFVQNFMMAHFNTFGARWLSVTWSLCIEEQFYLLLPMLITCCPPHRLRRVLMLLVVVSPVLRVMVAVLSGNTFPCYVLLASRWDGLLMGVLIASIMREPQALVKIQSSGRMLWIAFWILATGIGIISALWGNIMSLEMVSVGYYLIALFFSNLLLLALSSSGNLLETILVNKTLMGIGKISYSIYLLHTPVLGLSHGLILHAAPSVDTWPAAAVTLVALLVTIALASLSWRFLESPLLRWGHKVPYRSPVTDNLMLTP